MNFKLRIWILMLSLMYAISGLSEILPDPTRPAEYQVVPVVQDLPEALVDWKVTAIRISDNDRTAILNGVIVRAGDTTGPAKILEIQPTQVILDYENNKVAVRLFSDVAMRKPVTNAIKTESKIR